MFRGLAPVGDGFGMKMLKKMGWQEGQPIGKQGEGHVEPICVDVKMDRTGKLWAPVLFYWCDTVVSSWYAGPTGLTTESDRKQQSGGVQPASVLKGTKADSKTASLIQGEWCVCVCVCVCVRACTYMYYWEHILFCSSLPPFVSNGIFFR